MRRSSNISTQILYDELVRRGSTVTIFDPASSLLGYTTTSGEQHLLFSTCSDKSSATGVIIADNKSRTALVARYLDLSAPAQVTCHDIREARKFLKTHRSIVIKPALGSGGKGVSTNISSQNDLERAYLYAKKYSNTVIAQQHIIGEDVRLLIVDGTFCSAIIRKPAHVIGDGISSLKELISEANADELRNNSTLSSLMHINQVAAIRFVGNSGMSSVPELGQEVRVVGPANVSLGGSLHEATHLVTSTMIADAEKITRQLGLGICGVDMMWDQKADKHYLIEVNATPGIDIHDDPFSGTSSNCVERYIDWLLKH